MGRGGSTGFRHDGPAAASPRAANIPNLPGRKNCLKITPFAMTSRMQQNAWIHNPGPARKPRDSQFVEEEENRPGSEGRALDGYSSDTYLERGSSCSSSRLPDELSCRTCHRDEAFDFKLRLERIRHWWGARQVRTRLLSPRAPLLASTKMCPASHPEV